MPEALNQLALLACLCNPGCNIYMGFLEAPVHCLFLDAYQVDNQVRPVYEMPDALIIPGIEAFHLDHLQNTNATACPA